MSLLRLRLGRLRLLLRWLMRRSLRLLALVMLLRLLLGKHVADVPGKKRSSSGGGRWEHRGDRRPCCEHTGVVSVRGRPRHNVYTRRDEHLAVHHFTGAAAAVYHDCSAAGTAFDELQVLLLSVRQWLAIVREDSHRVTAARRGEQVRLPLGVVVGRRQFLELTVWARRALVERHHAIVARHVLGTSGADDRELFGGRLRQRIEHVHLLQAFLVRTADHNGRLRRRYGPFDAQLGQFGRATGRCGSVLIFDRSDRDYGRYQRGRLCRVIGGVVVHVIFVGGMSGHDGSRTRFVSHDFFDDLVFDLNGLVVVHVLRRLVMHNDFGDSLRRLD